MINANLKLSIGVERTSEDSSDEHQGNSALKCKNVYDVVSIELKLISSLYCALSCVHLICFLFCIM